ncbi:hypothetical protein KIW84_031723 [Lathyrus oleraceus]|uniref:Uncharacterized protein n=1 Tax=Pisum sativum TaxID=3888 RepID=A0A9D5AXT7_PEA|nr:hypothetical protein KIW84_031723 [Pisum sativum]
MEKECVIEDYMIDELDSVANEDSCEGMPLAIRFNEEEEEMTKDSKFKVGMKFSSLKQFKKAILEFYLRNMYANFKKKFGGGTLFTDLMMAAPKATYYEAHEAKMMKLRKRV